MSWGIITGLDGSAPSPQNLSVSSVSGTSATLSWDAATDESTILGYRVYLDGTLRDTQTVTGASHSYVATGIADDATHLFVVVTYDDQGEYGAAGLSYYHASGGSGDAGSGKATPAAIIGIVRSLLQDPDAVTWPLDLLLDAYNEGVRQIVTLKPNAGMGTYLFKTISGAQQFLPGNILFVQGVDGNVGSDGTTRGAALAPMKKSAMDRLMPEWLTMQGTASAILFDYDVRDPLTLWLYPPSDGTGYLSLSAVLLPDTVTSGNYLLALPDAICAAYGGALVDYVLYRAFGVDQENPAYAALSAKYLESFIQKIGAQAVAEQGYTKPAPQG